MIDDLVKRLHDRAKEERLIQANNEAVATALMGQRLLFDQGHRSPSNTYAVRLALNHENCARQDAKLAADWDEAADRIEALEQHVADLLADVPCACGYDNPTDVCMKHLPLVRNLTEQLDAARADTKKAVDALRAVDALDPEGMIDGCSQSALRGLVLRMGHIARATLAEIEGANGE